MQTAWLTAIHRCLSLRIILASASGYCLHSTPARGLATSAAATKRHPPLAIFRASQFQVFEREKPLFGAKRYRLTAESAFASQSALEIPHREHNAYIARPQGLPIVYHEAYSAPKLPEGHRFPMGIFKEIYELLLREKVVTSGQVVRPEELPTEDVLLLVHEPGYLRSFLGGTLDEQMKKRIGFNDVTSSATLIWRTLAEVAGTLLTARLALAHGLACNTAGGTHHAFPGAGSGFCILNDAAVVSKLLLAEGCVKTIAIVDLDVHQGDGTAAALQGDSRAFTMSVHCQSNFPARKQMSDLDIGLADGTADDEYLSVVGPALNRVLDAEKPDLVLYNAGVDPHKDDSLGRLCLTDQGLLRRELLVLDACLARGIPVAGYVGGGYSNDLSELSRRHSLLHRAATEMWSDHRLSR